MDIQLNFLQFQPQINWFDYFVNRKEIFDLFNSCEDNQLLMNLCDQFIEQALMAERDLAQFDKKYYDQDDFICLRHKSEDLWLFAISCFSSAGWDINSLNKSSNIIRIQAFLNRLIRWAFEHENEQSLLDDPFNFICSIISTEKFTPFHIFFAWLYTQWIFTVNLDSKFPNIPAKPTVSNPYQYVDTNLLQAEKLAQITIEVQQKMPKAVELMNQLIDYEEKLGIEEEIDIPLKECFYPKLDIITKEHSISAISNFPKPNFENGKFQLERNLFKMITFYNLMVAHFSSRHFTQSRIHLEQLRNYWTVMNKENLRNKNYLITIDEDEITGYSIALGLLEVNIDREREEPLIEFAKHRPKQIQIPTNLLIEMLKNGSYRMPKFFREKELRVDEVMQRIFIQDFNNELNELRRTNQCNQYGILLSSLYFLCTHCYGFADTLQNRGLAMDGFRIRNFANISPVEVSKVPPNERFQEFSNNGNALWNLLTTFDMNVLRNSFTRLDSQIYILNKKMIFSPITADPILSSTSTGSDSFFSRNQIMLWKLEQLARLGNEEKWKTFVNEFSEDCKGVSEHKYLLLFDALRIQLANWNNNFYRPIDRNEFAKDSADLKKLVYPTVKNMTIENKNSFQSLSKDLVSYILNNRDWKFVIEYLKVQPQFDSPFTHFAVIFSIFFSKLYQENKRSEASKIVHDVIWKVIFPSFVDSSIKTSQKIMINKEQLLEVLNSIKDIDVISIFIGLTSFLYNYLLSTNQKPMNISLNLTFDANISTGVNSIMDTSQNEDGSMHQQNCSTQLLRNVGRNIYEENAELWKPVKVDNSCDIDLPYIEKVLDLLCRQAKLVAPIYLPWLRFRADYAFAREKYHKSAKLYLEILMAFDRGLLGKPGIADEDELAKKHVERIQKDKNSIYAKLSVSLYFLQMPTLAIIVGQLRSLEKDNSHLNMANLLLKITSNTVDSGPTYFPLIADIHLMEKMAAIYESLDLLFYRQSLLKSMPTRAINMNNSYKILNREFKRRKERFIEMLYKQFFVV